MERLQRHGWCGSDILMAWQRNWIDVEAILRAYQRHWIEHVVTETASAHNVVFGMIEPSLHKDLHMIKFTGSG